MARQAVRRIGIDETFYGDEPILTKTSTDSEVIRAWNWYRYFKDENDAKAYVVAYFKNKKDKEQAKKVMKLDASKLIRFGWNCRMLTMGSELPGSMEKDTMAGIAALCSTPKVVVIEEKEPEKPVISIKERVQAKASDLIADLEDQVDKVILEGQNDFDALKWFRDMAIKPAISKLISNYYTPLYNELFQAYKGTDKELRGAYSYLKRPHLKKYMEFVKSIVSAAETQTVVVSKTRKPRKKKDKPASSIVSKLKYQVEDTALDIKSIRPEDIVGASQVWVYNTKYKSLTVFNAVGTVGLSIKGTTVIGFDEATSSTKKVRKPGVILKSVVTGGKLVIRKIMSDLKTKAAKAKGRINSDTILLRAIK